LFLHISLYLKHITLICTVGSDSHLAYWANQTAVSQQPVLQ